MKKDRALPIQRDVPLFEKALGYGNDQTYAGRMVNPDGYARVTGPCGDTDEIFLRIKGGKIKEIRFITDGCILARAACSATAHLAAGKLLHQCFEIDQETIMEHLGGLPESHVHCASLAVTTLTAAVKNYVICGRKNPSQSRSKKIRA